MDSQELIDIKAELKKLSDYIQRPFPDTRIWRPDETCRPFYLSNLVTTGARNRIFSFSVSKNMLGVIAKVCYQTSVATAADPLNPIPMNDLKQAFRLRIVRGEKDATNDNSALLSTSESVHGALQDYIEDSAAGQDEGFCSNAAPQECRVLLKPGFYWVQVIGPARHYASMFGWVWPNQPRKP